MHIVFTKKNKNGTKYKLSKYLAWSKDKPITMPYPTTHGPISSPILPIFVPAQQQAAKPATWASPTALVSWVN